MKSYLEKAINTIKERVGDKKVICALSDFLLFNISTLISAASVFEVKSIKNLSLIHI